MADAAREHGRLAALRHDRRQRRMVPGMPDRRGEEVAQLRHGVGGGAVRDATRRAVVDPRLEVRGIDRIRPRRRIAGRGERDSRRSRATTARPATAAGTRRRSDRVMRASVRPHALTFADARRPAGAGARLRPRNRSSTRLHETECLRRRDTFRGERLPLFFGEEHREFGGVWVDEPQLERADVMTAVIMGKRQDIAAQTHVGHRPERPWRLGDPVDVPLLVDLREQIATCPPRFDRLTTYVLRALAVERRAP